MAVETHRFEDDGGIPNSPLPVLVYHDVEAARDAAGCEALFARDIRAVPLPGADPVHGRAARLANCGAPKADGAAPVHTSERSRRSA
jgi:hypothetical protein